MRRKIRIAIIVCLLCLSTVACLPSKDRQTTSDKNPAEGGTAVTVQETGTMLNLTPLSESYAVLTDDSGMSGTAGTIHLHSNRAEDMYRGQERVFVFDIGHTEKLGRLYLWNYNAEGAVQNGVKEIAVSFSEDNALYSEPKTYILEQASGEDGLAAGALLGEESSYVDFEGVSGRYIRIEANSNYGGEGYGLSEVRLFRYKQPIIAGQSISCSPLERYINNQWSAEAEDYNLTNGAGLSDSKSPLATCDNRPEHMYAQKATAIGFSVDLKGQYPVGRIVLWNYNDPEHLDWGLKKFRLRVSDDYTTWKTVGTYEMEQADGSDASAPGLTVTLKEPVSAHYIQLEILSNFGGEKVGLSEISVFLGNGWYCDSAPEYTALLSSYQGWTGADGIYTVDLDGKDYNYDEDISEKRTFFVFSDTILSTVDPVTKLRSHVKMVNNTSALLKGKIPDVKQMEFYYPGKEAFTGTSDTGNIIPDPPLPAAMPGKNIYYWLGDTFVSGNYLYVYCLRIDSVQTVYGFEQVGVDLARYEIKNHEVDYDSLVLFHDDKNRLCDVSDSRAEFYFGGAVYQNTEEAGVADPDGYVYVYGYQDKENLGRELVVSRVRPQEIENFSAYEYLDAGRNWVKEKPEEFCFLADSIAPEISVTQIQAGENKGRMLLVYSYITNSPTIKAAVADSPDGIFSGTTTIYTHDDCLTLPGHGNNTYNAKAHPALSTEDTILISYNINGDDCFRYADIYRPRFIRLGRVKEIEE